MPRVSRILSLALVALAVPFGAGSALAGNMNRQTYDSYSPSDLRYFTRDDKRIAVYFDQGAAAEAPDAAAIRENLVGGMSEPGRNYLRFEVAPEADKPPAVRVVLTFTGPRNAYNVCKKPPEVGNGPVAYDKVWLSMCRGTRPMVYADARLPGSDPAGQEMRDFFKQLSNFAFPQSSNQLTKLERQRWDR